MTVLSQIEANIVHLLFVKYNKNPEMSRQILTECLKVPSLNLNHVDSLKATPLHVAMRKRQHLAVKEAVETNKAAQRCIFNFNVLSSRGHTALHYAIEK